MDHATEISRRATAPDSIAHVKRIAAVIASLLATTVALAATASSPPAPKRWVATWATAQQLATTEVPTWLKPPPPRKASPAGSTPNPSPGKDHQPSPTPPIPERIANQTVRMIAHVSIGGPKLRVELSNAHGPGPVTIGSARVALAVHSNTDPSLHPGPDRLITVGGRKSFSIEPGALLVSDPVDLPVAALSDLIVSLYVPGNTTALTVHSLGLHTTYIAAGDVTASKTLGGQSENESYFWPTGIDVLAPPDAAALVAFGDSITDGFATTPNTDRAWPAVLSGRLLDNPATATVAVLNVGISGNRLLHDGAGTNALARFDRDVLARPAVRWILLLEGINDISFSAIPAAPPGEQVTRDELIEGYRKFIAKAHVHGIQVIGATILPWEGVWTFNEAAEAVRQQVNHWILTCGLFDHVIDFDAITRDPAHPRRLLPRFDSGDHVHPNDAGNEAMARAIDIAFFNQPERSQTTPPVLPRKSDER